jgi:hypothetical protein
VEISGQKRWTTELRLASACSFSSGAGSCSIARSPLAELTVATAAMATSAVPYAAAAAAAEKVRGFGYRGGPAWTSRRQLMKTIRNEGAVCKYRDDNMRVYMSM